MSEAVARLRHLAKEVDDLADQIVRVGGSAVILGFDFPDEAGRSEALADVGMELLDHVRLLKETAKHFAAAADYYEAKGGEVPWWSR